MDSHMKWTLGVVALVAWWALLLWLGKVLSRSVTSLDVTRRSRRPRSTPSSLDLATAGAREWFWRAVSRAAWAVGMTQLSLRYARRAGALEKRRHRRAETVGQRAVRDRAWASYLSTPGSSPSSARTLPPSAPRPATPEDEATRLWERTLPHGTPSPLLTREGMGRPYPFVPLADPPPSSASTYRSRPSPARGRPAPAHSIPNMRPRRSTQ